MIEKIKELLNNSIHKELPECNIIGQLQTQSIYDTTRQDLDENIQSGVLKFRYVKGEKYISLAEEETKQAKQTKQEE
jgi:hypothetical protein